VRASIYYGPGDIRVETVPDPSILEKGDAVVRVTHACICGSDLWFYRGQAKWESGWRTGHEWMGIVEDAGSSVTSVKRGDRVLAPFAWSDGTCEFCKKNIQTSCMDGGGWGGAASDGGQGEAVRVPFADANLVAVPEAVANDEALLRKILPLTDVMGTGHHAALAAQVRPGGTAAVIGDGAVGLCAVLAARRLGAERVIVFGHHEGRLALARDFGATDVVRARGEEAIARGLEITNGGAESVLECVGTESAMATACAVARPAGTIGYVGVPYGARAGLDLRRMFSENIALRGGVAPVRAYMDELLKDVLAGTLDPSPVFDLTVDLDGVPRGYAAMDDRTALKVLVKPA
jgi:threonine dehydrogenase-like Zn-dependent dehydrogenase